MRKENRRLNVGFVFDDSLDSEDGVAQYVKTLGKWLTDRSHRISYLVGETKKETFYGGKIFSLSKNVQVVFNGNRMTTPLPASRKKIKEAISNAQYDVLHVQVPYSPLMAGRVIARAQPTTAVVGTFHILPTGRQAVYGSKFLKLIYGRTLRRFDAFYSVSEAARQFAHSSFEIRSSVLPNTIDTEKFKTPAPPDGGLPKIVFLGRLVKRKGCFELIKAYELARQKGLQADLVIAGHGPQRKALEEYVNSHNLSDSVKFLGFVKDEEKAPLLAGAEIACFPSTGGESFGIVLIEAMAAGSKTILAGDNPGYRSVLGERPDLLVDPRNTEQFAERLKQILSDKDERRQTRQWLAQEVKKYDVNVVGRQLEEAYYSAIAKRYKTIHNVANGKR